MSTTQRLHVVRVREGVRKLILDARVLSNIMAERGLQGVGDFIGLYSRLGVIREGVQVCGPQYAAYIGKKTPKKFFSGYRQEVCSMGRTEKPKVLVKNVAIFCTVAVRKGTVLVSFGKCFVRTSNGMFPMFDSTSGPRKQVLTYDNGSLAKNSSPPQHASAFRYASENKKCNYSTLCRRLRSIMSNRSVDGRSRIHFVLTGVQQLVWGAPCQQHVVVRSSEYLQRVSIVLYLVKVYLY